MVRQETNKLIKQLHCGNWCTTKVTRWHNVIICNKMHWSASPVPCPVLQTGNIFVTVPNLRKDSANVSNGADGVLVIVVFHRWWCSLVLLPDYFRSFVSAVATAGEHESNGQVTQGIVTSLLAFCNTLSLLRYFLRYSVLRYFVTR